MGRPENDLTQHRRQFLTSTASGLGAAAVLSLLQDDGVLAAERPLSLRPPHFTPKARNCIFIFLAGGTSQVELFDPKPKLASMTGQRLPDSFFKKERFFSIKPDQALVMGSRFGFRR